MWGLRAKRVRAKRIRLSTNFLRRQYCQSKSICNMRMKVLCERIRWCKLIYDLVIMTFWNWGASYIIQETSFNFMTSIRNWQTSAKSVKSSEYLNNLKNYLSSKSFGASKKEISLITYWTNMAIIYLKLKYSLLNMLPMSILIASKVNASLSLSTNIAKCLQPMNIITSLDQPSIFKNFSLIRSQSNGRRHAYAICQ